MVTIELYSNDGYKHYLKQLTKVGGGESNVYLVKTILSKVRISRKKDSFQIRYIDLAGGPRITVGKRIRNTELPIVKDITFYKKLGWIITFEQ